MLGKDRYRLIKWAKQNLAGEIVKVKISDGGTEGVRQACFTSAGIDKSLTDRFNQSIEILELVHYLKEALPTAHYLGQEEKQHTEQTSVVCYHRFSWKPSHLPSETIHIILRELYKEETLQVYYFQQS